MKKRILPLLLAAVMITAFAGCGKKPDTTTAEPAPETTAAPSTAQTPETTKAPETAAPETTEPVPVSTAAPETTEASAESSADVPETAEAPLEALDYSLPENWAYYSVGDNKPVDVFLICPTVDTRSERNALDLNEKLKGRFVNALDMEKGIYEETARMFSPLKWTRTITATVLHASEATRTSRLKTSA